MSSSTLPSLEIKRASGTTVQEWVAKPEYFLVLMSHRFQTRYTAACSVIVLAGSTTHTAVLGRRHTACFRSSEYQTHYGINLSVVISVTSVSDVSIEPPNATCASFPLSAWPAGGGSPSWYICYDRVQTLLYSIPKQPRIAEPQPYCFGSNESRNSYYAKIL